MKFCSKVTQLFSKDSYIQIETNSTPLRLWFLTDHIVRIRAGFDGDFAEESYSLMLTGWEDRLDSLYTGKRTRITPVMPHVADNGNYFLIQGNALDIKLQKEPLSIEVYDKEGTLLHKDVPELAYIEDNNRRRIHTSVLTDEDHFYGFGEKSGSFNKAEHSMNMSPSDAFGYNPKETDSLYKHIPFYIKLNEKTKKAVGYFYHNTYECEFDMGRKRSNYWEHCSRYRTDGGDIDLFFITGPKITDILERYTDLTGKSALLPKHALGYLGSSMYYSELPNASDDAILEFIDTARKEGFPISGFQLSSGYTAQDTATGSKRCVFTWNKDRFKDPAKFFAGMTERGIVVSPNVKPGILLVHPDIDHFKAEDILVKHASDNEPCIGNWWGGPGVFADFTSPKTRKFWKSMLKEKLLQYGTDSVWNDNCEYDSIADLDARCSFDGKGGTIGQLKPVMANLMCHLTEEAIQEHAPARRPFIVCRAGYAGIQQYAQTWSGDNRTSWDTLKYNVSTMLGMSLSGVSNYGCDIGGFGGPSPEPELLVRWVQNGIFHPRFSIHSVNSDNTVTEPWMYPEYTSYIRSAIHLRYRLLPYLYSLMYRAHTTGLPIMQPLCCAFQEDIHGYDEAESFMIGSILVATVLEEGATVKSVYFPNGSCYYDFYTRKRYDGGQSLQIPVTLDSIPMYLTEGAIVPMTNTIAHNLTTDVIEDLRILCVPGKDSTFELYEDDGCTTAYKQGVYKKTTIDMRTASNITFNFSSEGTYVSPVTQVTLDVVYPNHAPLAVLLDNKPLPQYLYDKKFRQSSLGWYYNLSTKSIEITYPAPDKNYTVTIATNTLDMLGM